MIAVALKGLAGRKIRALLTALAVVIGVSMISGTLILTDTMQKTFDGLFAASYKDTDAVIQGKKIVGPRRAGRRGPVVAAREGQGAAGSAPPAAPSRPPRSTAPTSSARRQRSARRTSAPASTPRASGSAHASSRPATDRRAPTRSWSTRAPFPGAYKAGDSVQIDDRPRRHAYTISGPARYGEVDSLGFGTFAVWESRPRRRSSTVKVSTTRSRSPRRTAHRRLRWSAPSSRSSRTRSRSRTGPRQPTGSAELGKGMSYIRYFLLGFGAITLFVSAFMIFNTLSITVARRTRESPPCGRRCLAQAGAALRAAQGPRRRPPGLDDGPRDRLRDRQGHGDPVQLPRRRSTRRRDGSQRRTMIVSLLIGTGVTLLASIVPARQRPACRRSQRSTRARRSRSRGSPRAR